MDNVTAMLTCTKNAKAVPLDAPAPTPEDEVEAHITLEAVYRPIEDRGPEEALYGKYTPGARLDMSVIGTVADNFVEGQRYKVTFEPMD